MWQGGTPGRTGYVFTDELGAPYRPDWLSHEFERAQALVPVDRLVFHGLRHTSATILLAVGVPVHVVSERLGHANVRITLDTYAHVIPTQHTDAARIIGAALYGETEGAA